MTTIEKALLDALESLQREHEQQLTDFAATLQAMQVEHAKNLQLWVSTAATLQDQYERTQAQTTALSEQVSDLAECVESLSSKLRK